MLFIKTLLTMFVAEMGDKTQFLLIAMASKYRLKHILIGTAAGVLLLNCLAVCIGSMLNNILPVLYIKLGAGIAFLCFAYITLFESEAEKQKQNNGKPPKSPTLSVFATFFIAELGDKTQLTALTFAASEGIHHAFTVFCACCAGLFAADLVGLCIGYFLKANLPRRLLSLVTFGIFSLFGLITIHEALHIFHLANLQRILITTYICILFCFVLLIRTLKRKELRKPFNGKQCIDQKTKG